MFWPCETRTSTCRSFATISSGLYRFLAIAVLLDVKDIPQVGPLQWGWITDAMSLEGLQAVDAGSNDPATREAKHDTKPKGVYESIGMVARLGNVLYWAGTLVACLIAGLTAFAVLFGTGKGDPLLQGLGLFVAAAIWLIGRAARYVLAGR